MARRSMGAAEFKVVLEPHEVRLIIHGNHVVAKTDRNVYGEIFDYIVRKMGGRIDGL